MADAGTSRGGQLLLRTPRSSGIRGCCRWAAGSTAVTTRYRAWFEGGQRRGGRRRAISTSTRSAPSATTSSSCSAALHYAARRAAPPFDSEYAVLARFDGGLHQQSATPSCPDAEAGARRRPMPRRDDIQKILLIGSGPIVIGQAAEFDYSGVQACKVLLEEGYEVVLVNSNPATIMTDPEFADRTYVEPLLPGPVAEGDRARATRRAAADAGRPDRAQPRQGAARRRHPGEVRGRADRRRLRGDPPRRGPRGLPRDDGGRRPAGAVLEDRRVGDGGRAGAGRRRADAARSSSGRPSPSAARAAGSANTETEFAPGRLRGAGREPDQPGAGGGVGDRLGRVRARGDAGPQRQRRDHLLDRERGPDGRPHRRLGHDRARPDPDRRALPGAPRPGDPGDPRRRRRDRRLQHPVRGQPRDERDRRDRDEPARLALLGAGLEGDRASRSRRSPRSSRSATRWRRSPTTSHERHPLPSSRRSTTSSPRCRASPSRSSRAPRAS